MLQDIRYALRLLAKSPGFTLAAILTLALGIGANTAIYSLVYHVLLRPLPYPQPEQLTMVWVDNRREKIPEDITSYPNLMDWRAQNQSFHGLAGMSYGVQALTGVGEPEEFRVAMVTANFFDVMGVPPALGRAFTVDDEKEGNDNIVIIGHGLWQRRFGGDPKVIGQTIHLSGRARQIVGIMPAGFQFPPTRELWEPLAPSAQARANRGNFWLYTVGRMKPGVTPDRAHADMATISARLEKEYPDANQGYGANVKPLHQYIVGEVRPALLVLWGAVLFLLLITCANIANLLLARAGARGKEMAVRAALGAGSFRLIRQLLIESLLLAALGGVAGVLMGFWTLDLLRTLKPGDIPRWELVRLDPSVLAVAAGLTLLTGVLFGLAPALSLAATNLSGTLKEGSAAAAGGSRSGRLLRQTLVGAEMALALMLLAGAGLLLRTFWNLRQVDPGLNASQTLVAAIRLPPVRYNATQAVAFFQQVQERLAGLPGVQSAGATSAVLSGRLANSSTFSIEGRPAEPQASRREICRDAVTPSYFRTVGIPVLRGREFNAQDGPDAPRVAIINEATVRLYFPNEDPLGKRLAFGDPGPNTRWMTIVGVIRDVRRYGLDTPVRIEVYLPHAQAPSRAMELVVRTAGRPLDLAGGLRSIVQGIDKDLPLAWVRTLDDMLDSSLSQRRLNMMLVGMFALAALSLAAVGIYGVMSHAVSLRRREIGVRMALGADSSTILRLILKQGLGVAAAGAGVGLAGALALSRFLEGLLFGVRTTDPLTFLAVPVVLLAVAAAACWLPARRAARTDPLSVLRYE